MKAFSYVDAANEKDALASLGTERNQVLAIGGGMDLLGMMKDYLVQPVRLVNVKRLDATIARTPDGGLRIGSAVRLIDLIEHADARRMYPALVELAEQVGTPQIRNAGTVGGNLNQRPRCWYFRNEEFHCLKKGGATCFSVNGENQFHAIFGEGPCHIVHPSNLAVACLAYGATFRLAGPSGAREVEAEQYFQMPDHNLYAENVLQPNELLTHVTLPAPMAGLKSAAYEVRFKQAHDWPLAFATAALVMEGQTVKSARIVMGAVAPVPWRANEAERALAGKTLSEETAGRAALAAVQGAQPMSRNAYKVRVARTAVTRAILKAGGMKVV
ncbi:MAG: xanthine dehydrogenase family protein subunit M [Acidobacteriota bacterium]|nr:xanthine dehydrogenase family protein subunit M [Acidobacteriota bacterium]